MTEVSRQLGHTALRNMSTDEIVKARKDGRLDDLLAGNDPERSPEAFAPPGADQGPRGKTWASTREWLRDLDSDTIVWLHREGHLDRLLKGE